MWFLAKEMAQMPLATLPQQTHGGTKGGVLYSVSGPSGLIAIQSFARAVTELLLAHFLHTGHRGPV